MGGYGSNPQIFPLTLSSSADKLIASQPIAGVTPDLVIPPMVKRVRIREQSLGIQVNYAFKAGDITLGTFMPLGQGEALDWNEIATFPGVYVRAGSGTPKLIVEVWT